MNEGEEVIPAKDPAASATSRPLVRAVYSFSSDTRGPARISSLRESLNRGPWRRRVVCGHVQRHGIEWAEVPEAIPCCSVLR
jgi:hypothetical protein